MNKYIAEKVQDRLNCTVSQGYGMTEASPAIVQPSGQAPLKHLSVGFPIPETSVRIHNKETGEDMQYNEWGNILVQGPQVMKGYHNDEETTRQVNRRPISCLIMIRYFPAMAGSAQVMWAMSMRMAMSMLLIEKRM